MHFFFVSEEAQAKAQEIGAREFLLLLEALLGIAHQLIICEGCRRVRAWIAIEAKEKARKAEVRKLLPLVEAFKWERESYYSS